MPLNDILNCAVEDLWSILDADESYDMNFWFLSKGIGGIELSKLGKMLDVDSYDNLMAGFQLVGEPREDGPWPQTIPAALIQRLSTISDEEIAAVVPHWVKLEEFRGAASMEALADYLKRLRLFLSERSGKFYLINAL
jgi:hypothetical protein